jgi:Fe2+ or Zn2+ uptake regulation protein
MKNLFLKIELSELNFSEVELDDLNNHVTFICQCCGAYKDMHCCEPEATAPICLGCWNDESQDAI